MSWDRMITNRYTDSIFLLRSMCHHPDLNDNNFSICIVGIGFCCKKLPHFVPILMGILVSRIAWRRSETWKWCSGWHFCACWDIKIWVEMWGKRCWLEWNLNWIWGKSKGTCWKWWRRSHCGHSTRTAARANGNNRVCFFHCHCQIVINWCVSTHHLVEPPQSEAGFGFHSLCYQSLRQKRNGYLLLKMSKWKKKSRLVSTQYSPRRWATPAIWCWICPSCLDKVPAPSLIDGPETGAGKCSDWIQYINFLFVAYLVQSGAEWWISSCSDHSTLGTNDDQADHGFYCSYSGAGYLVHTKFGIVGTQHDQNLQMLSLPRTW